MLGWLRRLLGLGSQPAGTAGQAVPRAQPSGSSVPPPPRVSEQLEAAQRRLKDTVPPPGDDPGP